MRRRHRRGRALGQRCQPDDHRYHLDVPPVGCDQFGAVHGQSRGRRAQGDRLWPVPQPTRAAWLQPLCAGRVPRGGGETALSLDTLKVNRIESRFGAKLDGATSIGTWSVRPSLQADYVRLLSGADAGLQVAFAAARDMTFALPLTGGGSGWMEMKGGVEMTRGKFSLGLSGQATAGDAPLADQRGAVEMKLRF
ncbi:autotransporter outer membrane beta-barrel domain-containing protein [Sphingomonas lutea]|uniref:Autotransporter outer membrane beta-barrel domain-containing protein n=1 Tax=Sphingomonas lutea TaxID=1045317 RepID=A0A7G9SKX2_9SPHN|nr:autotransporter outer membrane beta-barrel domain-containing protein [Sphingomonas lutea]